MSSQITRLNPERLHDTPGYSHVTIAKVSRIAFLAGQCPLDQAGELVGPGDLRVQVDQVAANAVAVLDAVGAGPPDVVRSVIYVVSSDREVLSAAWSYLMASTLSVAFTSASTLVGVAQLGFPGQLVEVDLTAALPDD